MPVEKEFVVPPKQKLKILTMDRTEVGFGDPARPDQQFVIDRLSACLDLGKRSLSATNMSQQFHFGVRANNGQCTSRRPLLLT